jgi:hypothetical protein
MRYRGTCLPADSRRALRRAGIVAAVSIAAVSIAALLAGCCGPAKPQVPSGVLPMGAVSWLPAKTQSLSAADVQKDSTRPGLAAKLSRWGYRGGWQRTFQGESRRLTLVVSRSLMFGAPSGAAAFVAYLTGHMNSFYPFALTRKITVAGRPGLLIKPPLCACHMAEPLYAGVTAAGRRVHWLEINGPRATGRLLISMLAEQ